MKRYWILIFLLICIGGLSGCIKGVESCPAAEVTPGAEAQLTEEEFQIPNIISSNILGQGIYDALEKEWSAWDAKSEEQKLVSSHLPGICYEQFDTWEDCEAFLGFSVFNPLEDSEFEKGTYVGMPVNFADAEHFYVNFYGPNAEQVQWIDVQSGYCDGDVRITVNAQIQVDTPKENPDEEEPLITEDSGELYVATTALLARGPVTYSIRVIGEANCWDEVRETLNKVLPYFEEE